MPVAALYVPKGQEIAVSDLALRILKDQDQIGKDKLTVVEEVENTQGPIVNPKQDHTSRPNFKMADK